MKDAQLHSSDKRVPRHIAIIMDGNGRWAEQRGKERTYGHENGRRPVRESVEAAIELGVEYLTLYTFSTENWKRPASEVRMLMGLLYRTLQEELAELIAQGVRLNVIGEVGDIPAKLYKSLQEAVRASAACHRLVLTLALNYGGRQELLHACSKLIAAAARGDLKADQLTEDMFANELYTHGMPDPELVIRTSGEQRVSNFLLWQLAYAELLFLPVYWPDFRKEDFRAAVQEYQHRSRRFGGV